MSTGHLLVLGGSILWMLLCMRFWYAIDREHIWQRRFIAIGAGIGGGLIYLIGTLMLEMLKEARRPCSGRRRNPGVSRSGCRTEKVTVHPVPIPRRQNRR
jgi:hypothetical protein